MMRLIYLKEATVVSWQRAELVVSLLKKVSRPSMLAFNCEGTSDFREQERQNAPDW
jgi:hypothetical protein